MAHWCGVRLSSSVGACCFFVCVPFFIQVYMILEFGDNKETFFLNTTGILS